MLRMIQSRSAGQAKEYFSEALVKSDYYLNDQELPGYFRGKLSDRLGISGKATKDTFFALCENRNPVTGKPLTPRTKQNRTTGYDLSFHCPKSVSILHVLSDDGHILKAFEQSVQATMRDIEKATKTRVRQRGVYEDRQTGELAWAEFIHQTARPVEGHVPDPHLHAHCFTFNATWDDAENKIKAAKFREIQQDMPYFQRQFHKRLSDELVRLGYRIRLTDHAFEIEGVPDEVIRHFSKRTNEIGQIAKEKGITDAKALDGLGAKTRSKKQKGHTMESLKAEWKNQIRQLSGGTKEDSPVRHAPQNMPQNVKAKHCIDYAIKHCFERASVVSDKKIMQTAYRFAMGNTGISVEDIRNAFIEDTRFIRFDHGTRKLCTTKDALREEKRMVELARKGIGKLSPLYQRIPAFREITEQQAEAVAHVLTTTDQVTIIRGAAGTGKTKLMQEAEYWIKMAGKKIIPVAPTAEAARGVLKNDGFENAETVAKLLTDEKLQRSLSGQVLWVDEAGLLGTKDMLALLELAIRKNARVVLGGDTRQHSSVSRGDALRILNTVGNIRTAEVTKIRRQKSDHYRSLVQDLSRGKIKDAFDKLDHSGAIKEIDPLKPHDALVTDYLNAVKRKKSALIISPTHKEGDAVTQAIRHKLREMGRIGKDEISFSKLTSLGFTEAEKCNVQSYRTGQVVQFSQNTEKFIRGSVWRVVEVKDDQVYVQNRNGHRTVLPHKKSDRFDIYNISAIGLSKGDSVRITKNGFDKNKKQFNNGSIYKVDSVTEKGSIVLVNRKQKTKLQIDRNFGHIAHAYCITSHASQGKTVDEVFIAQPSSTFAATDLKQFYVSVSRGKEAVHIYTDDKAELFEAASEHGDRKSALELVSNRKLKTSDYIRQRQRSDYQNQKTDKPAEKGKTFIRNSKDVGYEPQL